jgi:hypothetical protein
VSERRRDFESRREVDARDADPSPLVQPTRAKGEARRTYATDPRIAEMEEAAARRIFSSRSPGLGDIEGSELAQLPEVLCDQTRPDEPVGIWRRLQGLPR